MHSNLLPGALLLVRVQAGFGVVCHQLWQRPNRRLSEHRDGRQAAYDRAWTERT